MLKRPAFVAGLTLVLAASALPAQEWRGKARIEGTVKSSTTGEPIAGAKVSLRWSKSGHGGPDVTTGKGGHFTYFGLAGGNWDIDFEAQGFQTRKITAAFEEGVRNEPIDIKLEPIVAAGGRGHRTKRSRSRATRSRRRPRPRSRRATRRSSPRTGRRRGRTIRRRSGSCPTTRRST